MIIIINTKNILLLKGVRKIVHLYNELRKPFIEKPSCIYDGYCDKKGQKGNDAILQILDKYKCGGLMISKWGTIEFSQALTTFMGSMRGEYLLMTQ